MCSCASQTDLAVLRDTIRKLLATACYPGSYGCAYVVSALSGSQPWKRDEWKWISAKEQVASFYTQHTRKLLRHFGAKSRLGRGKVASNVSSTCERYMFDRESQKELENVPALYSYIFRMRRYEKLVEVASFPA